MSEHRTATCIKTHDLLSFHRTIPLGEVIEVVVWDTSEPKLFIDKYWGATFWLDKSKFKGPE